MFFFTPFVKLHLELLFEELKNLYLLVLLKQFSIRLSKWDYKKSEITPSDNPKAATINANSPI